MHAPEFVASATGGTLTPRRRTIRFHPNRQPHQTPWSSPNLPAPAAPGRPPAARPWLAMPCARGPMLPSSVARVMAKPAPGVRTTVVERWPMKEMVRTAAVEPRPTKKGGVALPYPYPGAEGLGVQAIMPRPPRSGRIFLLSHQESPWPSPKTSPSMAPPMLSPA